MNNKAYEYERYMKHLPYIKDVQLYKAVGMTLYLIIDKNRPLRFALSCSSKKHNAKPVRRIEDLVRLALPDDFFAKRQRANAPQEKLAEAALRRRKLGEMDAQAESHINSILGK